MPDQRRIEWTTAEPGKYQPVCNRRTRLETPIQADDISITKFIAQEDLASFEAWSETNKVGTWIMETKTHSIHPNSFIMLLNGPFVYFYIAEQYSQTFHLIDELKSQILHTSFTYLVKFYCIFRSNASVHDAVWYGVSISVDVIKCLWWWVSSGADDCLDLVLQSFLQIHNKSFIIGNSWWSVHLCTRPELFICWFFSHTINKRVFHSN